MHREFKARQSGWTPSRYKMETLTKLSHRLPSPLASNAALRVELEQVIIIVWRPPRSKETHSTEGGSYES